MRRDLELSKILIFSAFSLVFSLWCLFFVFPEGGYQLLVRERAPDFTISSPYIDRWRTLADRLREVSFLGRIFATYSKNGFSTLFVGERDGKLLVRSPTRDLFYDLYSYVSVYKGKTVRITTRNVRTVTRVIVSSEEADFGDVVVFYQPGFVLLDISSPAIPNVVGGVQVKVEAIDHGFLELLMDTAERGGYLVVRAPSQLFEEIRRFCRSLGYEEIPAEFIIGE